MSTAAHGYPLGWVGEFVASIKPHVFVRREDSLLILMPNQAYRLNPTGLRVLEHMLGGGQLEPLLGSRLEDETISRDLYHFFCDLRALVSGCLVEGDGRKAIETMPFEATFSVLPVLSEVALTYRCNLSCRFCYAGCTCRSRGEPGREMSTEEIESVLAIIRGPAQVPSVSFTGGEPTLRADLTRLVGVATGLGLRVNLITNATLVTPDLARRLAAAGLRSAQVSIEGPDAEAHDAQTSVGGSFDRTWRGLAALGDAGIKVMTNTTLTGANAPLAEGIVELLAARGVRRFAMNMLMPCGSAKLNEDQKITYSEIGPVVLGVKERARRLGLDFHWYSPTPYCIFNPVANGLGNKSCAACDGLLSISPAGDVLPCSSFDYGVGNILAGDFRALWRSARPLYWRAKRYAPPQCSDCSMFGLCTGACPLYWQAYGTEELDAAREAARSTATNSIGGSLRAPDSCSMPEKRSWSNQKSSIRC